MQVSDLVDLELQQRDLFKQQIMEIVLSGFTIGNGYVKRGILQRYVYNQLGFHGRSGNHFARFISKVMAENGFRVSYYSGQRVYYGLAKI